jgi:Ca-activated chloride channel family protein
MGNYKDSKLEILAKKGNGNFAYLDNEKEAEKVLVKELTQTLYSVADDAYLSISFNPDLVKDYRLIGFDNKVKAISDSLSELEGGEVGSGHTLMAMFEIVPANQDAIESGDGKLASAVIHYRYPMETTRRTSSFELQSHYKEFNSLPACHRFAASVAEFAMLLKSSRYAKAVSWSDVIILANESYNANDAVQAEFIGLVEKARKIYGRSKRRKI